MAITFADHTFKRIFYNENYDISVLISVKFFPMYLTQFDSGRHMDTYTRVNIGSCNGRLMLDGTKPLSEAMLTHKKSPVRDVHLRAILQEIPQPPITKVYLKTTFVKYLWNIFSGNVKGLVRNRRHPLTRANVDKDKRCHKTTIFLSLLHRTGPIAVRRTNSNVGSLNVVPGQHFNIIVKSLI